MKPIQAFPLCWPPGYPRVLARKKSKFAGPAFYSAVKNILLEIKRLGGKDPIVSTNVPLRSDGMPFADYQRRLIVDPGVAVYFQLKDRPVVLACDKWLRLEDNVHAVAKSIDAMRGLDRWGVSDILERAFQGFLALPAPTAEKHWSDVLMVTGHPDDDEYVEASYRALAKRAHPDNGGSAERMAELNRAIQQFREERKQRAS